jgi:hypothetical protein
MYRLGVDSNGIKSIPNKIKAGQVVEKLKGVTH